MRRIEVKMDLADVDPNGVFENQTLGSAGNFNLNGIEVTNSEWVSPDGFAKKIGFGSTGNISGVNFVISGDKIIEIQGTAEKEPFSFQKLEEMYNLARKGAEEIHKFQLEIISE